MIRVFRQILAYSPLKYVFVNKYFSSPPKPLHPTRRQSRKVGDVCPGIPPNSSQS